MLDAIRMSGRMISTTVLQRMTDQTVGPNPPPRRALLQQFCRATHWRNRRGELCLASANVCLNRLEAQGLVRLPPPEPRRPRPQPRRLRDDGAPLPPLPDCPAPSSKLRICI